MAKSDTAPAVRTRAPVDNVSVLDGSLDRTQGIALDGCRIESVLGHAVEIIDGAPRNRNFPDRVNESLGICLKAGPEHDVRSDGRLLRYPADTICVRAPGTVWSTPSTGFSAFLSIDVAPRMLPEGSVNGPMRFVARTAVPMLQRWLTVLRSDATALAKEDVVTELVSKLVRDGIVAAPDLSLELDIQAATRARELLTEQIADPPSLQELADAVGANRFVLLRSFRRQVGITPHAYVLRLRIERARMRIANGADISETSFDLGFADQSHLSRLFKRVVGVSPGAYRRAMRTISGRSIPFKN